MMAGDQRADGLEADIGGEQEELDRDELLGARLGRRGEDAMARKAPRDDRAREALDAAF